MGFTIEGRKKAIETQRKNREAKKLLAQQLKDAGVVQEEYTQPPRKGSTVPKLVCVAEFLENVGKLKSDNEKIATLRANETQPLKILLAAIYDPKIRFNLPPGAPPYTPNNAVNQEGHLPRETRKIPYFMKEHYPDMNQRRREELFVELLETVDRKDAILLINNVKDKKPIDGITYDIVNKAFPGIFTWR